ncbi:response regulator [bacterium]|nr:response regulator [bacterium]
MKTYRILIVDDEPENLKSIVHFIEKSGLPYELYQVLNSEAALKIAEVKSPDLVICDWDMPDMNGLELVKHLKASESTREIPVIMFTGVMTTSEHLELALKAGAVDYIRKPLDQIELLARIRTVLELSDSFKQLKEHEQKLMRQNRLLEKKQAELQEALDNIKTLRGLIPICVHCKKVRDDEGFWKQVETYVSEHSLGTFSHGLCPACMKEHYPDIYQSLLDDPLKE